MGISMFDVAVSGDDEQRIQKQAVADKIAAATYDVRHHFGQWLFGASDLQAWDDRAKLAYVDICKTIEPHIHARTGVYRKVMKALQKEWRDRLAAEDEEGESAESPDDDEDAVGDTPDGGAETSGDDGGQEQDPFFGGGPSFDDQSALQDDGSFDDVYSHPNGDPGQFLQDHGDETFDDPNALVDDGSWDDIYSDVTGDVGQYLQTHPDLAQPIAEDVLRDMMAPPPVDNQQQQPPMDPQQMQARRRQACWPGCHEDEAHAKKFHDDAKGDDSDKKESRRRHAGDAFDGGMSHSDAGINPGHNYPHPGGGGPSVREHHTHELVDQRAPASAVDRGLRSYDDSIAQHGDMFYGPGAQQGPRWSHEIQSSRYAAEDGAYERNAPDHPELDTDVTYEPHTYDKLEPEGDFDAYKDRVDQGADSKVDHDFTSPDSRSSSPYHVEEHNDNGDHNFVPTVTGARRMSEYERIARMVYADISGPPGAPGMGGAPGTGGVGGSAGAVAPPGVAPGGGAAADVSAPAQTSSSAPAGTPVTGPMAATASREYQLISAMIRTAEPLPGAPTPAGPSAAGSPVGGPENSVPMTNVDLPGMATQSVPGHLGRRWAHRMIREVGTKEARKRLLAVCRSKGVVNDKTAARIHALLSRKVADSNYLQKADEALTKVLNEKAEEFQNTIAPLQQALITIQQAEQMANPLNVSPPAGTVNVLPGQQSAGSAAMGATGGGVGMGADPAAAGLAGQPATQAMQQTARKRGGRGKA